MQHYLKRANSNGMLLLMPGNLDRVEDFSTQNVKMFANGKVRVDVKSLNFGAQEGAGGVNSDNESNSTTKERD